MDNIDQLQFQKLDFKGLQILLKWAEEEGWNPGPNDADVFWQQIRMVFMDTIIKEN